MRNVYSRLLVTCVVFAVPWVSAAKEVVRVQIVSLSSGTQTNVPITFGHVFTPTDVKITDFLSATRTDDTAIPLQVDKKAMHDDGSLRYAVLTVNIPSINAGPTETIILSSVDTSPMPPPSITLGDLKNTIFDFSIFLSEGGMTYTSSIKDLLTSGKVAQWLSGPIVSEWLVSGPILNANGVEHPHLTAYYHVRAYGPTPISSVRVNVVVENDWAYQSDPQNYNYTITLSMAGATVDTKTINHYHHARWNEYYWWGTKPEVNVKYDSKYFLDVGAITNYDRSIVVSESLLNKMLTTWSPMESGALNGRMPAGGGRPEIGPLPVWAAAYVISQDLRSKTSTLLHGRASGSFSFHFRDKETGKPVSIDTYPEAGTNWTAGDFPPLAGEMAGLNPSYSDAGQNLMVDTAHHPDLAYVPYLITGDYFFLEEVQFWANYCMLRETYIPKKRNGSVGYIRSAQERGQAWCLRAMGEAAYITPDSDPFKTYITNKLSNNLDFYNSALTNGKGTNELWNIFGALRPSDINRMDDTRPWMDDFFTWAVGHLVEMGFNKAIPLRAWKAQYPVGRMTRNCYIEGINYRNVLGTNRPPVFLTSWDEFYELNYGSKSKNGLGLFGDKACASQEMADWKNAATTDAGAAAGGWTAGMMSGRAHSPDSYYANAQPAMAIAKDSGIPNSDIAWALFVGENSDTGFPIPGSPITPDYSSAPQWAVVPRKKLIEPIDPGSSPGPVPDNLPPYAEIQALPREGDAPFTVSFSGENSIDFDGTIAAYLWDFGDGTGSQTATIEHTFNVPGTFTVTLTVTDNDGGSTVAKVSVRSLEPQPQGFSPTQPQSVETVGCSCTSLSGKDSVFWLLLALVAFRKRAPCLLEGF